MAQAKEEKPRRLPGRRNHILDVAERLARSGGYHGFSFRDVAAEVGVKSASIHYHFPTKTDLTVALTERYKSRFVAGLGPRDEPGAVLRLIAAYREALTVENRMCLCGVFAAEYDGLPEELQLAVRAFFADLIAWAEGAMIAQTPEWATPADGVDSPMRTSAETLVAGLEGAMLTARATGQAAVFDRVAVRLLDAARGKPWRVAET